ncbi:FAD-binding domain-containing protein [Pleurostoma richardsiae]|uniref:FAD-binding domain-containing protein n=1 Tax=Pleurostoma richardsiae TaxID=41990 RepID=A0AA38S3L7_9PEZI|nr:FAD-binding domain-containing protein [Pleurostoma richardsiae]
MTCRYQSNKHTTPFLTLLILLPLLSLASLTHARASAPLCKSLPGTPSWPSPSSWARLNESTGGRLLQPPPPGAVCHPGQPTHDPSACAAVRAGWPTYEFHGADPVSSDWNQWNNDSCLPDPGYPCSGRGYPVFVVNASAAEHVTAAVQFARRYNVRLIVRSTGHDYIGRSTAPNSLSIWTRHMGGIRIHSGSFQPKGCGVSIPGDAVTAGAGTQMAELYEALDAVNSTVVGGGGKTVSVGGYLTGGGHGLLSPRRGLGADQVLEMEVVAPRGAVVTVNECQNEDLFWAMRGGGGSTFGIMTSVTLRTFPTPKLTNAVLLVAAPMSGPGATTYARVLDVVTYLVSQLPALGDAGLAGYTYLFRDMPSPFDGGRTLVGGMLASLALQDSLHGRVAIAALLAPIMARVRARWPEFLVVADVKTYGNFLGWFGDHFDASAAGTNMLVGSWLLGAEALTGNTSATREAVDGFLAGGLATAYLISGKGVWEAKPRGGGNAVLPAWREAYVHATVPVHFAPLNATAREDAFARLDALVSPLRKLAPGSGAYMNEANPREADWQRQFWGENYPRLLTIKRAVDPDDVLWCSPCVGNERWREIDGVLCQV